MKNFIHKLIFTVFLSILFLSLDGQEKLEVLGIIKSSEDNSSLEFVLINSNGQFFTSDEEGKFNFVLEVVDSVEIVFSHIGFNNKIVKSPLPSNERKLFLDIKLDATSVELGEVQVTAEQFKNSPLTPLSVRSIGKIEITKSPGSGSDIARVMQILPGVATTSSFRNDLIIRGGAPSENSFYLDEFYIPTINHLTTQGASGGAVSMINSNLIRKAELISGNFPANRGNALSSVFQFDLQDGDSSNQEMRISAGANNLIFETNGPIGDKATYVASLRRSYRQYILRALNLAVYPIYNDALLKIKIKPSYNHEITLLGIGALDKLRLNSEVNSEVQNYLVDNLPLNDQWNYTTGIKNKFYRKNQVWTLIASRNHLFNKAWKEIDVDGSLQTKLNYESNEINNRLSGEYMYTPKWGNIKVGVDLSNRNSEYDVFNLSFRDNVAIETDYTSNIRYNLYGMHIQFYSELIPKYWSFTAGLRADGTDYSSNISNPLNNLSPRISTTINFSPKVSFTTGYGSYRQLPSDLTLGYTENDVLINQDVANFIESSQFVSGLKLKAWKNSQFTFEIFQKIYSNYPFNTRENISQANEGGEFGVAGNSPIVSDGKGQSQGFEFLYEQKMLRNWFGTLSYTYSNSEFENIERELVPSSWDANHILNAVIGRKFANGWQLGTNIRYQSALPYTPYDLYTSSLIMAWSINNSGIRDYSLLNSERGKSNLFIDIRLDKEWNYKWGDVTFYLDLENILADADSQQILVLDKENSNGQIVDEPIIINPNEPFHTQRFQLKELQNAEGVLIPTFGFIVDF